MWAGRSWGWIRTRRRGRRSSPHGGNDVDRNRGLDASGRDVVGPAGAVPVAILVSPDRVRIPPRWDLHYDRPRSTFPSRSLSLPWSAWTAMYLLMHYVVGSSRAMLETPGSFLCPFGAHQTAFFKMFEDGSIHDPLVYRGLTDASGRHFRSIRALATDLPQSADIARGVACVKDGVAHPISLKVRQAPSTTRLRVPSWNNRAKDYLTTGVAGQPIDGLNSINVVVSTTLWR